MKRILLPALLAILGWIAFGAVGCGKSTEVTMSKPWPPDTIWAVRQADQTYSVYSEWPPDTTIGSVVFNIMSSPPPAMMMMTKSTKHETSSKMAASQKGAIFPHPWPPDTLMLVMRLKTVMH